MKDNSSEILIRPALSNDAPAIAPLLLLAMEDLVYEFIGQKSQARALTFLSDLIALPHNQYSYQNCWVLEYKNQIVGAANLYPGEALEQLRQPVAEYISKEFRKELNIENETEAGEYYIDSVGISPDFRGLGLGRYFFEFLIDYYVKQQGKTLGLIVDFENPRAKKLYSELGFKTIGTKRFAGGDFYHMQLVSL